jgi:hypothetical protein
MISQSMYLAYCTMSVCYTMVDVCWCIVPCTGDLYVKAISILHEALLGTVVQTVSSLSQGLLCVYEYN